MNDTQVKRELRKKSQDELFNLAEHVEDRFDSGGSISKRDRLILEVARAHGYQCAKLGSWQSKEQHQLAEFTAHE